MQMIQKALIKDRDLVEALNDAVQRALAWFPAKHHERVRKAHDIVLSGEILVLHNEDAVVESSQNCGQVYEIRHGHCNCPDATHRSPWCKHAIARALVIRGNEIYEAKVARRRK